MNVQVSTNITAKFSQLYFKNENIWSPLPIWARFYLTFGSVLARFHEEKVRYVAALALPTKSYAASLIGSGFACANNFLYPDKNKEHLELIVSLPNGTPVKYINRMGRLLNGIKREVVNNQGKISIGIQKGSIGRETIYVAEEDVNRIEVSSKKIQRLPGQQKGRIINPPSPLLEEMLDDKSLEYAFQMRIDGLVIGSYNSLKQDASALLGMTLPDGSMKEGFLFELFRVEGFNSPSAGHRFLIQSPVSQEPVALPKDELRSRAVLFDGSLGFVKWREYYRDQNWIIVLDRTEPNFENAVNEINQEYYCRSDHNVRIPMPPLPSGIELMLFARDV